MKSIYIIIALVVFLSCTFFVYRSTQPDPRATATEHRKERVQVKVSGTSLRQGQALESVAQTRQTEGDHAIVSQLPNSVGAYKDKSKINPVVNKSLEIAPQLSAGLHQLVEQLHDEKADVRATAAAKLGMSRSLDVAPALVNALTDKDQMTRIRAHRALSQIFGGLRIPFDPRARASKRADAMKEVRVMTSEMMAYYRRDQLLMEAAEGRRNSQ